MAELINNILVNQAAGTVPPPAPTGPTTTTALGYAPTPVGNINRVLSTLSSSNNVYYPLEIPKYYLRLEVSNYSRASLLRLGTLVTIGNIILPLPHVLIDAHNVSYDAKPFGPGVGAFLTARGGPGRPDNVLSASQPIERQFQELGVAFGGAAQSILGSLVGTILNPAQAFLGIAPNRFLTVLLEGPAYKEFTLTWRFSPKTEQESEALRIIRRDLNNYMSPGLGVGGLVFRFPKIFKISIMPNSKYMYKFKPAVIKGFHCNYTPGGQAAFYKARPGTDNLPAPEGIDMALTFLELEYWLEGDYNDSNDASRNGLPNPGDILDVN